MGSVPPLLAFLLITFSGWVHRGAPVYTMRRDGAVVHEDAVYEKFANEIAAEDAAYG